MKNFNVGNLTVDAENFTASLNGTSVAISATEFRVLLYLANRAGTVVTRKELLQFINNSGKRKIKGKTKRVADVHISRIKRQFKKQWNIQTIWKRGWSVAEGSLNA